MKPEKFEQYETPCLVVAHPDDETISSTQFIEYFRDRVHVVFVTGSRERDKEAQEALFCAGLIDLKRIHFLDFPETTVYRHCLSIRCELVDLLASIGPDIVITHAFEGGHFDHDLTRFLIEKIFGEDLGSLPCLLAQFALYYCQDGKFHHNEFIDPLPTDICLTPDERLIGLKRRMIDLYESQTNYLKFFDPGNTERLRICKIRGETRSRFLVRPHSGTIGYDHGIDPKKNWDLFVKTVAENL